MESEQARKRFVAGGRMDAAIRASRRLNSKGVKASLDILHGRPRSAEQSRNNAVGYKNLLDSISESRVNANVSLKPTQIGLTLGVCLANLEDVVQHASQLENTVTLDMEEYGHKDATVRLFGGVHEKHGNVALTIQAYLRDSLRDAKRLVRSGAALRLVKGVYDEPADVAYQDRGEISENYMKIAEILLKTEQCHAFGTHDEQLIGKIQESMESEEQAEFQTLLGVKPLLPVELAKAGYAARVYVPYGPEWRPYVERRLEEENR